MGRSTYEMVQTIRKHEHIAALKQAFDWASWTQLKEDKVRPSSTLLDVCPGWCCRLEDASSNERYKECPSMTESLVELLDLPDRPTLKTVMRQLTWVFDYALY